MPVEDFLCRRLEFQAVIVAGYENSIYPLTQDSYLPLTPMVHNSLLFYALNYLEKAGFTQVIIVCPKELNDKLEDATVPFTFRPDGTANQLNISVHSPVIKCTKSDGTMGERHHNGAAEAIRHLVQSGVIHHDVFVLPANLLTDMPFGRLAHAYRMADHDVIVCMEDTIVGQPDLDDADGDAPVWIAGVGPATRDPCVTRQLVALQSYESFHSGDVIVPHCAVDPLGCIDYKVYRRAPHCLILSIAALRYIAVELPDAVTFDGDVLPFLAHTQLRPDPTRSTSGTLSPAPRPDAPADEPQAMFTAPTPTVAIMGGLGATFMARVTTRWSYLMAARTIIGKLGDERYRSLLEVSQKDIAVPTGVTVKACYFHLDGALGAPDLFDVPSPEEAKEEPDAPARGAKETKEQKKARRKKKNAKSGARPAVIVKDCSITASSRISGTPAATTRITDSVIHSRCTIGEGCELTAVVVCSGAVVGAGCRLADCVVGPRAVVPDGTDNTTSGQQAFVEIARNAEM